MTEAHTLVVGIGNRHRGDDALGCLVAAELADRAPPGLACIEHDGEPAGLIDCWQGVQRVVLVDAVSSGAEAGKVFRVDLAKDSLPEEFHLYSTHAFGVPQAVELARALGCLPPEIRFIGVEGETFDAGTSLSPELLKSKDTLIAELLELLAPTEKIDA